MAKAYYSTIFEETAAQVWQRIRDFGAYTLWVDEVDEAVIEDGRTGDTVGAVRAVRLGELRIRQRLLAHSDLTRSYTYEALEPLRFPQVRDFRATLCVTPITDGDRAFVQWWAEFDCPAAEFEHWTSEFATLFAGWLASLRTRLRAA